ncbi:hypothetical protein FT663_01284 [Candidozyma haemuli var. vulneris]|nr:hypothetical protein FT662_01319 [[Candida] haemuloni var. vulneris]KAF3994594.1 hypothetical protein FT663_01284 [[Candida] haemuloni var. vulneris]
MVVLAACICTHGGKALLSRSFRHIDKDRITALLANFPGLLSQSDSQNTTVEDESVRYVYQPLEEFYVVVLTNKQSNILQDIDTLHLFVSVVSNVVRSIDEKELLENAFEILSAFDEIATLGYKEKLTLSQVQTYLEMDSHEEKIQEIIERNKELEAIEERRRRAKEIQRKELARKNMEQQQSAMFGSQSAAAAAAAANNVTYGYPTNNTPSYDSPAHVETDSGRGTNDLLSRKLGAAGAAGGAGLQLGKKAGKVAQHDPHSQPLLTTNTPFAGGSLVSDLVKPAGKESTPASAASRVAATASPAIPSEAASATASPAPQGGKPQNEGILITVSEKITADISREGSVVTSEVKGDLQLRINDPSLAKAKILLKTGSGQTFQYKTHPNVDRALFNSQSVIGLKDKAKSFPSNDQSLGVLRWRASDNSGDNLVPLLVTAWVGVNDGVADVTLEYEIPESYISSHPTQESIDNVQIIVPIDSDDVQLKDESGASVSYTNTESGVVFELSSIPLSDPSGTFEFSIPAVDEDALFPISVGIDIHRTEGVTEADVAFGQVQVLDVTTVDEDEASLPFTLHSNVVTESYTVQ